jgi:hypothetical protein
MSFQVGRIGLLALALSACSGVADPTGLSAAGGDLLTAPDALALEGGSDALAAAVASGATGHVDGGHLEATASPTYAASGDSSPSSDAGVGDAGAPVDATLADAVLAEGGASQAVGEASVVDSPSIPASCSVTFTVADAFIDGVIDTAVALGGDTTGLGNWDPAAAVPMTSIGAGAWTLSLVMNDGDAVQFLFVKRGPSSYAWEDWGVNSNRSLVVSCAPLDPDAGAPVDGGPVVGTSYAGEFGVKPPDAT